MRRSRIRQPHPTSNINTLPEAEGLLSFLDKTTQLFLYLILMLEQMNQTQYLKPNNLSTLIIGQAMRRSRIRQPHPTSKIKPLPGAEGILSFPEKTTQLSFFIASWRWSRQTRQTISNRIIYQLLLLIKQ